MRRPLTRSSPQLGTWVIALLWLIAVSNPALPTYANNTSPDDLAADAEALYKQAKYEDARALHEQRIAALEQSENPNYADIIDSMVWISATHWKMGRHPEGERVAREAITSAEHNLGPRHPMRGQALNILGLCCMAQSKFDDAGAAYREAYDIFLEEIGEECEEVSMCLNNLGALSGEVGDLIRAEAYYKQSLAMNRKLLGDDNLRVARGMHNLGFVYHGRGDYLNAVTHLEQALDIRLRHLGDAHPDVGLTIQILGQVYGRIGDEEKGYDFTRRALEIRRAAFGDEHHLVAWNLRDLSNYELRRGNLDEAEVLMRQALMYYEQSAQGMEHARALIGLAKINTQKGHLEEADDLYAEAMQITIDAEGGDHHRYMTHYATSRARLGAHDEAIAILVEAAEEYERSRLMAASALRRTQVSNPNTRLAAEYLITGQPDKAWPALERSNGRVFIDLVSESEGRETGWVHELSDVQAALAPDEAIVGWLDARAYQGQFAQAWAWVVRHEGPVAWQQLAADELPNEELGYNTVLTAISPHPANFREALRYAAAWPTRLTDTARIDAAAHRLWQERIAPVEAHLQDVDRLVVVPSVVMLGIPVETLVGGDGRTMSERFDITYAASTTAFRWHYDRRRERRDIERGLLVGAPPHSEAQLDEQQVAMAPILDTTVLRSALGGNRDALSMLPPLPEARTEVGEIAVMIDDPTVLVGRDASEATLNGYVRANQLGDYDVLHFATHAIVDPRVPDVSALILSQVDLPDPIDAGAGDALTDGLLTVSEIIEQWRLDADLVTLSGCQTATGRAVTGEGYLGFSHAFFHAGTQALVVSLWDVDDTATRMLMTRFYENLTGHRDGQARSKAAALREAKHWLRHYEHDGVRPFAHPAYWSSFILIGDPS